MATTARSFTIWPSQIYAPGNFRQGGDVVTLHVGHKIQLQHSSSRDRLSFPNLMTSRSLEVQQLTQYFVKNVLQSIAALADPYGKASDADPFEYRSIPNRSQRTIYAKPRRIGRIQPSPLDDD